MSTRTRAAQVLAAAAVVGLLPLALTAVHLPRAGAPQVQTQSITPAAFDITPTKYIAIHTATPYTKEASSITLDTVNGPVAGTSPQTLSPGANCVVNQGTTVSSRYLTITGSVGSGFIEDKASYSSGSIGVAEKKSGTSCYRVDSPSEALDLKLGKALPARTIAASAFLDLELKQSARILATLKLTDSKGNPATQAKYELQSGATTGLAPLPGTTGTPATCTGSADSGPDSGTSDNCRWAISSPSWTGADDGVYFDEIVLEAVNGSFSLEGGSDGTYAPAPSTAVAPADADASIIQVVDSTLTCGQKTQTLAADSTTSTPEVTVSRLDNADGSACVPVPYTVSNGPGFGQFLKPLNSQAAAQLLWDTKWTFPATAGTTRIPDLKIDYEVGNGFVPLGWCPSPVYTNGVFTGLGAIPGTSQDQDGTLDGVQFACVVSRTSLASGTDQVVSRDVVYVYGDARLGSG